LKFSPFNDKLLNRVLSAC